MKLRGCIFDLDGTLLNTLPVCYAGFRSTLREFCGREYSDQEIRALLGPSEEGIFKALFPEKWKEGLQSYLDAYSKAHAEYAEPFPGIPKLLTILNKRNIRLAIVSGKGPGSMAISLQYSGLKKYFEVVQTGSESGANKPGHIREVLRIWGFDPREVAYIGDVAYDITAARAAGTVSIGAVWAETADRQRILGMSPDYVFKEVQDMIDWAGENL